MDTTDAGAGQLHADIQARQQVDLVERQIIESSDGKPLFA